MSCCKSNTSVETGCPAVTLTPLPNHTTSLYNTIHIQCCTNLSPLSLSSLFPLSTPKRVLPVCILFRKLQSMDCCTIYVYLICLTRTCFQFCCLNQSRRTLISTQQTHTFHGGSLLTDSSRIYLSRISVVQSVRFRSRQSGIKKAERRKVKA